MCAVWYGSSSEYRGIKMSEDATTAILEKTTPPSQNDAGEPVQTDDQTTPHVGEKREPITGSIGDTDYNITVEQLKVEDQEVNGIQVEFEELDLKWFIHSYKGYWRNSFVHTPNDNADKLPSNLSMAEASAPFWMAFDKKHNAQIVKALHGCGLSKKGSKEAINAISGIINAKSLMDKITATACDDRYCCERSVLDADIDYNNPLWFMINNKFSAKAVAERVIASFAEQHHFIKTVKETRKILVFNDGMYVNGEDEVEKLIRDFLHHRASINYVKETKDEIRIRTLTLLSDFNPGNYINLQNGVYKIDYKTFYNTEDGIYDDQNMLFTYKLSVFYDADAVCPEIEKFFTWAQPDPLHREQVYEEFSYGFAPGYPIQRMAVWIGEGKNGKGVAVNVLRSIIGINNISGWSVENLEKNTDYCQANMVTKKFNICGDMPSKKVPFDFIKKASGGDVLSVREIRKEPFDIVNACKMLFSMNNMFEMSDLSEGATRRMIVTTWDVQVEDADMDPHLSDKLTTESEKSGFFNLLMDSYDNLMERGHFIYNPSTEETEATLSELRGEDVQLFIAEKCVTGQGEKYARVAMYDDYKAWHESRKAKPKAKGKFNASVKKLGYKTTKMAGVHLWTGIGRLSTGPTQVEINLANNSDEIKISS